MIDLRCCSVETLLDDLERTESTVGFVHADPPWSYTNDNSGLHGVAGGQYATATTGSFVANIVRAYSLAAPDCYLLLWATFPMIGEWFSEAEEPLWSYVSGGAWNKSIDGKVGIGYHWRGNVEPILLYKKGAPKARALISNAWSARRLGHSEKPQIVLRDCLRAFTTPGLPVLDLYAGESGSLARACRMEQFDYVGAEIDPDRHRTAMHRIGQGELFG